MPLADTISAQPDFNRVQQTRTDGTLLHSSVCTTSEMNLETHMNPINSVAASAKVASCFHSHQNRIGKKKKIEKKLLCPVWDTLPLIEYMR